MIYNDDALLLPYFMCSRETGFSMAHLIHIDSDLLIGQLSYKQSAEIYNHYNRYEAVEGQQVTNDWYATILMYVYRHYMVW